MRSSANVIEAVRSDLAFRISTTLLHWLAGAPEARGAVARELPAGPRFCVSFFFSSCWQSAFARRSEETALRPDGFVVFALDSRPLRGREACFQAKFKDVSLSGDFGVQLLYFRSRLARSVSPNARPALCAGSVGGWSSTDARVSARPDSESRGAFSPSSYVPARDLVVEPDLFSSRFSITVLAVFRPLGALPAEKALARVTRQPLGVLQTQRFYPR